MSLYQATRDNICCGIVVSNGIVIETAPYLVKSILLQQWEDASKLLKSKGWKIVEVIE